MEYEIRLTNHEIEILFEALETWEKEAATSAVFGGLLGAIFSDDPDQRRAEFDGEMEKAKRKEMTRKRSSILLQAKLIQALDECAAHELFANAANGGG